MGAFTSRRLVEEGEKPILFARDPRTEYLSDVVDVNKIKIVRGDILDLPSLIRTVKEEEVDSIVHMAGLLTAGVRENPVLGVRINVEGTMNVLETARMLDLNCVVLTSSSTAYYGAFGAHVGEPFKEDFLFRCLSDRPRSVYAVTKIACEWIGLNYVDAYGINFIALRYAGVFGPWRGPMGGLPGRLLRTVVEKPTHGEPAVIDDPLLVYQGGDEFIYVKDAANGTVSASHAEKLKNRVFNLGMGKMYSFQEITSIVEKLVPDARIEVKVKAKGGIAGYPYIRPQPCDISSAREELGFAPLNMEEAIRDYIEWIREKP